MHGRPGGGEVKRLADQFDGRGMLPHLMGNHAQEMQRVDASRILGEDLTVKRLGLREPAGLVMFDGKLNRLGNGQPGHR